MTDLRETSATSLAEQKERALNCGFDLHLAKPAQPAQLAELLRSYAERMGSRSDGSADEQILSS